MGQRILIEIYPVITPGNLVFPIMQHISLAIFVVQGIDLILGVLGDAIPISKVTVLQDHPGGIEGKSTFPAGNFLLVHPRFSCLKKG